MPLFYQHTINDFTKLAVWRIHEPEEFFLEKVNLQNTVGHPHKRLQHLAGRYLLQILEPKFPVDLISIAASKKPLLLDEAFHFSISHCGDFAAAIISKNKLVGIDVELVTPKIEWVKDKFLSERELQLANNFSATGHYQKLLTLFWSTKETVYKWYGKGALSFKRNICIDDLSFENESGCVDARFVKEKSISLKIGFRFFDNLCLAWVIE
ncbi:MAG: 4'-phosphopantetheinyl transferase superfamily protein [Ginsengibacter sp.]